MKLTDRINGAELTIYFRLTAVTSMWLHTLIAVVDHLCRWHCWLINGIFWLISIADDEEGEREEDEPDFNHRTGVCDGFSDPKGWYEWYT